MYVFYNLPVYFFFTRFHYFFVHTRILFWCLNMSIGNLCIFLLDLSLFACIFILDF